MNTTIFSTTLAVLVLTGSAQASGGNASFRPMPPLPPGATVLIDGTPAELTGKLAIKQVDGRKLAYLVDLEGQVYTRQTLYYPAVMLPPGSVPRPRPPFAFTRITETALAAADRDLNRLVTVAGNGARVTMAGTWGYFDGAATPGVRRGLTVSTVTVRNLVVPAELPTLQRLIATAKKAVKDHILSMPDTRISGEPEAENLGSLLVSVKARISSGWCGTAFPQVFVYDHLTGTVRPMIVNAAE